MEKETTVTINLIIESGAVVDMDIVANGSRTEYAAWGIDDPMTGAEAIQAIKEGIKRYLK